MGKKITNTEVTFASSTSVEDSKLQVKRLIDILLSDEWKSRVMEIRGEKDPFKKKQLKDKMPCFYPSGIFYNKKATGLQQHSGFICVDIDKKENAAVDNFDSFKNYAHQIPCIAFCGKSIGGEGYYCLIPIADPTKHNLYFKALFEDFKRCGITIDKSCSNVNRLRFVSYDDEPYINTAAEIYDHTLPEPEYSINNVCGKSPSEDETKRCGIDIIKSISENGEDITGGYNQWFEILCAIANTYEEEGRELAHLISCNSPKYTKADTDRQYTICLKFCKANGGYTIGTLFHYAKQVIGSTFDSLTKQTFERIILE